MQDIFEDDNGWVESCLPLAECVALHYPLCWVTGNGTLVSRWHCLGPRGLMGPFQGWGWVKAEEIQPMASPRTQCPEWRLAWAPAWGQRLLLVWESERRVRVFLGAGSRSLLRWAAPLRAGKRGLAL